MIYIGIIGDIKNIDKVIKTINNNLVNENIEYEIIHINSMLDNSKNNNISFDIIYIINLKNVLDNMENIKKFIYNSKHLILNIDLDENLRKLKNMELNVITCGYSNKATITVSSVSEEDIIIYFQRSIKDLYGNIIEPKEIKIYINNQDVYNNFNNCKLRKENEIKRKLKSNNFISKNLKIYKYEEKILNANLLLGITGTLAICGRKSVNL